MLGDLELKLPLASSAAIEFALPSDLFAELISPPFFCRKDDAKLFWRVIDCFLLPELMFLKYWLDIMPIGPYEMGSFLPLIRGFVLKGD